MRSSRHLEGLYKCSHFSSFTITVKTHMSRLWSVWPGLAKSSVLFPGMPWNTCSSVPNPKPSISWRRLCGRVLISLKEQVSTGMSLLGAGKRCGARTCFWQRSLQEPLPLDYLLPPWELQWEGFLENRKEKLVIMCIFLKLNETKEKRRQTFTVLNCLPH